MATGGFLEAGFSRNRAGRVTIIGLMEFWVALCVW